ncbi:Retrovirus-related Pol polyprotein from transposon TNT 1-94 [Cardamine amara subsp. amara]|uniref:Retrovirus-related Pol polyprotein from transposon TNT 1-94 n=1 Tax=Cardamine amara subsp. amara TaxID=228776 RepID=A0ABD1C1Z1_CARAN
MIEATVYCDSLSAICLAKDQVHRERTKHIDVRYHFSRNEKRIQVKKVGTADNPADMFTKPVPQSKFKHCLDLLEYLKLLVAPKGEHAFDRASGLCRGIGLPTEHRVPCGTSGSRLGIGLPTEYRGPWMEIEAPGRAASSSRSIGSKEGHSVSMKHLVLEKCYGSLI